MKTRAAIAWEAGKPLLAEQLPSRRMIDACREVGRPHNLRTQPGYDHSYYFIATLIGDHIRHHAAALRGASS